MTIKFKREPEPGLHCREDDYYYKLYNDDVSVSWVTLSEHEFNKLFYEMAKELGYTYVDKSKGIIYSGGDPSKEDSSLREQIKRDCEEYDKFPEWLKVYKKKEDDEEDKDLGICYEIGCRNKYIQDSKYCEKHTIKHHINNNLIKSEQEHKLQLQINKLLKRLDKIQNTVRNPILSSFDTQTEINATYSKRIKELEDNQQQTFIPSFYVRVEKFEELKDDLEKQIIALGRAKFSKVEADEIKKDIQSIKTNLNNIYNELGVGKEDRIMDKEEIKKY